MSELTNNEFSDALYDDAEPLEQSMSQAAYYGLGDDLEAEIEDSDEQIVSPFDPTQIRVEPRVMTIDLLLSRIREKEINLAPDFQREAGIWKDDVKSRLIESILIRIPLPAFYMDATNDEKWIVVDGLQRITTLERFVIDKSLNLHGLEFLKFDGFDYDMLPRNFQRRILETQITVYLIAPGTPPAVKFNIFKRINTGGLPLSAQEIRHALNQGKATELLFRLAQTPAFKRATTGSVPSARMADREFALRFLAFTLVPYTHYKQPDIDAFLSGAMEQINQMSADEIAKLESVFIRAMEWAAEIFDNDAFRKRYKPDAGRGLINKSLFEVWSINLSQRTDEELRILKAKRKLLRHRFRILLTLDREFDKAISQGTGDVAKVQLRFSRINQLIEEVLA